MDDQDKTNNKSERLFGEFEKREMKLFEKSLEKQVHTLICEESSSSSSGSSSSSSDSSLKFDSENVSLSSAMAVYKEGETSIEKQSAKGDFEGRRLDFSGIADLKNVISDGDMDIKKNAQSENPVENFDHQEALSGIATYNKDSSDILKELKDKCSINSFESVATTKDTRVKPMDCSGTDVCYDNVQIKVIDVPEDDDLFDFLKDGQNVLDETSNISEPLEKQTEEDLRKRELYRYLTESDPKQLRSLEVTPYQSGDEQESESDDSDSSSSDGLQSLSSENGPDDGTETKLAEDAELPEMDFQPLEEESSLNEPLKVRKKPGRKPNPNKPPRKVKPKRVDGQLTKKTLDKLEKSKEVTDKWLKDLEIPQNLSFSQPSHLRIGDLNQYLTCGLCKGYLYEASTITECMHTFCKNCIVRHCMEVSLHCPVCNILIHPTDPFVHIRLDRMIQDIVYKLLPSVAETEMENIKAFYAEHPEIEPREIRQPPPKPKISPKEKETKEEKPTQSQLVSLLLECEGDEADSEVLEKKFVRVTSSATVANVCNFLKTKLNLKNSNKVELYCCGDAMEESTCTLWNIQNKFFGDEDCLILLQYKVQGT